MISSSGCSNGPMPASPAVDTFAHYKGIPVLLSASIIDTILSMPPCISNTGNVGESINEPLPFPYQDRLQEGIPFGSRLRSHAR